MVFELQEQVKPKTVIRIIPYGGEERNGELQE
jgi:hypothetical protein